MNIKQLKLEGHDTSKKDKKETTILNPPHDEVVTNKAYRDEKLLNVGGQLSLLGKDYNEFDLQYNKQSVHENLFQRAVKTTIHIFYEKCSVDNYAKADRVVRDFLLVTRRRANLEEVKNDDIQ